MLGFLKSYMARQVELGRLRPHDVRASARAFIGMLLPQAGGKMFFAAIREDGLTDEEHIEAVVGIFLRGLEGKRTNGEFHRGLRIDQEVRPGRSVGGVDLSVGRGEVFGLVGPNGAGKTTLIKGLVGALRPSGGTARVMGLNPLEDRAELRQRIGYMPQGPALYEDLTARGNVGFFGAAHRTPDLKKKVDEVMHFTDLLRRADDPVHTFSGGMKRRVSLACALVHRPEVIFLDEPTAAVDPQLRSRFWKTFRELAGEGTTLFISTHLMDEAMLCDRIAILLKGRIIADDTPRSILEGAGPGLR